MAQSELKRILSKRGLCSRSEAEKWILQGLVKVQGKICTDPERFFERDIPIEVQGLKAESAEKHYIMLNKPRGQVVTRSDEKGRATIYDCLQNWEGPPLQAVGRLDQASEGLLLLSNDHNWSNSLMDPESHQSKIYHVQLSPIPSDEHLQMLSQGIELEGKSTRPAEFKLIRSGKVNAWVEVHLHEGRNRQIRKMLQSLGYETLRLIRIQIADLQLGDLPKGKWRSLNAQEIANLGQKQVTTRPKSID